MSLLSVHFSHATITFAGSRQVKSPFAVAVKVPCRGDSQDCAAISVAFSENFPFTVTFSSKLSHVGVDSILPGTCSEQPLWPSQIAKPDEDSRTEVMRSNWHEWR